jgi:Trm5-related predicted tRNA methylase
MGVRKISAKSERLEQAIKNARAKADAAVKTLKELEDKKKVLMAVEIGDVLRDFSIKPQDLRTLLKSIKNGGAAAPAAISADAADAGVIEEEDDYIPEPIVYEGVDYER